jgi:hypothetical protein
MAAPLLPGISDWQDIIVRTRAYTDAYRFDHLNMGTPLAKDIFNFVGKHYPQLLALYRKIYVQENQTYWNDLSKKIRTYCEKNQLRADVFF